MVTRVAPPATIFRWAVTRHVTLSEAVATKLMSLDEFFLLLDWHATEDLTHIDWMFLRAEEAPSTILLEGSVASNARIWWLARLKNLLRFGLFGGHLLQNTDPTLDEIRQVLKSNVLLRGGKFFPITPSDGIQTA